MRKSEIVIKTEVIKVDELQGREKQIYQAGWNNGIDYENEGKSLFFTACVILITVILADVVVRIIRP